MNTLIVKISVISVLIPCLTACGSSSDDDAPQVSKTPLLPGDNNASFNSPVFDSSSYTPMAESDDINGVWIISQKKRWTTSKRQTNLINGDTTLEKEKKWSGLCPPYLHCTQKRIR